MDNDTRFPLFQETLLDWFAANRRPLPWRAGYSPYATWIAEMMLQQTQMERGVAYFRRWMETFPDIASVAAAGDDELLKAWEGLGYYRRARYIKAAARAIMERHNGVFPHEFKEILALPGIGPYTAGAIASTAFNAPVPCVDGNVERVLSRVFDIDIPLRSEPGKTRLRTLARDLIPEGRARDFNQALMELGALACRKKPLCSACPMAAVPKLCESLHLGIAAERPIPAKSAGIKPIEVSNGILFHKGRLFIQRRLPEGIWGGLWEFPGGGMEKGETPGQTVVREWKEETGFDVLPLRELGVIRHSYTSYRVTMHCFLLRFANGQPEETIPEGSVPADPVPPELTEACEWKWIALKDIELYPLPAPHRKLADMLEWL